MYVYMYVCMCVCTYMFVHIFMQFEDTAFHCAVRVGNIDIIKELLDAGADVNATGNVSQYSKYS